MCYLPCRSSPGGSKYGHGTHNNNWSKTMNAMNTRMKAAWRKMVGTALLWVAFAALIYIPSSGGGPRGVIAACLGFACFASGLALFADGLKLDTIDQLRPHRSDR